MKTHAFKYRFYPTVEQKQLLSHTFGCVRFVYNTILFERLELYKKEGKRTSYSQASSMLTTLKRNTDYAWLKEVSCVPLQQSLRHQQTAFKNFFENRAKYPKFKKKEHKQSAEFTAKAFTYRNGSLCMAKSKTPLNIKWSRKLPCSPSTIIISKDCSDRYFVSCRIEREIKKLPKINQSIGIDLGIKEIAITSGGFKFENKRYTKRYALKLAKAQRKLSKKTKGSKRWYNQKIKVAQIQAKISDSRLDNIHKMTTKLINENQVICCESLSVKNMIKNRKLSKHIADASWGEIVRQLEYKADWYGRTLIKIDKWFPSSKRCNSCGYTHDKLPLSVRVFNCPDCGLSECRDINAARNILAVGQTVIARGVAA